MAEAAKILKAEKQWTPPGWDDPTDIPILSIQDPEVRRINGRSALVKVGASAGTLANSAVDGTIERIALGTNGGFKLTIERGGVRRYAVYYPGGVLALVREP